MFGNILAIYGILFCGNEILNNIILNKAIKDVLNYFDLMDNQLEGLNELVIYALLEKFIEEISTPRYLDYLPFISIFINIKNLYLLNGEIEEFLYYLESRYNDVLHGPILTNKKEEVKEEVLKQDKYFVSFNYEGKLVTIWFSYNADEVVIKSVSPSLSHLDTRQRYSLLLDVLSNIKVGYKMNYNYSSGIEECIKNINIAKQEKKLNLVKKY